MSVEPICGGSTDKHCCATCCKACRDRGARCYACDAPGRYSVLLSVTDGRLYLPNQFARSDPDAFEEVWFCKCCIRAIEDNLRATIMYLRAEAKDAGA